MATEGGASITSDELFDFPCSLCAVKVKNYEAEKYCIECQEYLCSTCVENHNYFPVMAKHSLIERSDFGQTRNSEKGSLPSVPTERCSKHPTKVVDMYCEDHDSVHCVVCITINHGLCAKKHYIPEYVEKNKQLNVAQQTGEKLESAITALTEAIQQDKQAVDFHEDFRKACHEKLKDFRSKINQVVDELEQAYSHDIDTVYGSKKSTLDQAAKKKNDLLRNLEELNTANKASAGNLPQQFVIAKTAELSIKQSRFLCRKRLVDSTINFEENKHIIELLKKEGFFRRQSIKVLKKKPSLYKVVRKESYCVKQSDDKEVCQIWSCCQLDAGDILMADKTNKSLKRLDNSTYQVIESLRLLNDVKSVCRASATDVAVSLRESIIQLINVEGKLVPTHTLKVNLNCRGIAVIEDIMYVAEDCGRTFYKYSFDGKQLRCGQDKSVSASLSSMREICFSDDNKAVHVIDTKNGLITIDRECNVLWSYSGRELNSPWGVCTDGDGSVFAGGHNSNNVVQLSEEGKYLGEVIPKSLGISNPMGLCFDKYNMKLIVHSNNRDIIDVFDLQQ